LEFYHCFFLIKMKKLILASKSPRRKELLKILNINFEVKKIDINEEYPNNIKPLYVAEYLANLKAASYKNIKDDEILLTADTIVIHNNIILGKPDSRIQAIQMLQKISNSSHIVLTGVCLKSINNKISFTDSTKVYFKKLKTSEIEFYVDNYNPFDKAGAYGIQDWIGAIGITKIIGSYFNVVGLPIAKLYNKLNNFDF
tara:strand:+ start:1277 stop:1873 length:597 start_codon:yes stop_codon:yes gene_type:complete